MGRLRVLLVDDNPDFLEGFARWLRREGRMEVVGRARTGLEAVELARRLAPDLVLMDIAMPDLNGFEATRRIKSEVGAPTVVLVTFHASGVARNEAWAAGADDLLAKTEVMKELTPVVDKLFPGRASATPERPKKSGLSAELDG